MMIGNCGWVVLSLLSNIRLLLLGMCMLVNSRFGMVCVFSVDSVVVVLLKLLIW